MNDSFLEILKPFEEIFYIPDSPDLEAAISLVFKDKMTKKVLLESEIYLNKSEEFLKFDNVFYCERTFSEKQRKFTFKSLDFEEEKAQEEELSQTFELKLDNVGISFIFNTGGIAKSPYELCYFLIKDAEFYLMEDRVSRLIQLKFEDLHLEHNSPSKVNFPLVFLRSKEKEVPILNIYIEEKKTLEKKLLYLNCFKMQIDDISVNIEMPFIQITAEFIKEIKNLFKKYKENPENTTEDQSFPFNLLNKNNVSYWQTVPFTAPKNNLYIKDFILNPLLLKVSYKTVPQAQVISLKSFFKSLQNIENANFPLAGLHLPDYFDNKTALLDKILYKYKEELTLNSFKLLGSVEILGNPIGLFNHISTGFSDLFEKPLEGMNKGPLDAGKGLITGVSSLVRNTLTGTFNSLDKISSSFGSGLAALSFNQDYMKKKQLRSETEAENVVEGLGQAGNSLYKGLENGITGIFLNPLEGAKEEGISGLIKGTFFGITGFFIKPISAIFDATSKTAIGLKNTVNIEENVKKTLRYKRPFYGVEKFYKEYWREDGEIVEFMEKFKKGKYAKLSFFDFVRVPQEGEKGEKILVIMIEMILLLSVKKKRKDWEIQTKNIRKIETLKDGLLIMLKEKIKKIEVFKKSFLRLF